jgi:uncharacterized protein (TIGR00290 family)
MEIELRKRIIFCWSGGKDSALALLRLLQQDQYHIVSLVCAVQHQNKKSTVHQLPAAILQAQATSLGIPIFFFQVKADLTDYEEKFNEVLDHFCIEGIYGVAFGDLSVSAIKPIREKQLSPRGLQSVLPLWDMTSAEVMDLFLKSGLTAIIIVTQADKLSSEYIGKTISRQLVSTFPTTLDVCGEFGEYHTVVTDGSIFHQPISIHIDEVCGYQYSIGLADGSRQVFTYHCAVIN